jgi:hypothetical protein
MQTGFVFGTGFINTDNTLLLPASIFQDRTLRLQ